MTGSSKIKIRSLTFAATIALLSALSGTEAGLSCSSPSGSARVGDSVELAMSGNNWWPRLKDVYSITANVYCSSGGSKVASMSISNGDRWTVPNDILGRCSNNQVYVQYTGTMYDVAHLAHILPYWTSCDSLYISEAPPPPTTTTTTTTTKPATTNDPPPTTNPPTQVPTTTSGSNPTVPTPTTANPPVYTTTYTLIPTVISGTSTIISVTTVVTVPPTLLPTITTIPGSSTVAVSPDSSQLPGLPSSPNGQNNGGSQRNNTNTTNVPAAALGAVGGVAALALIVFGLVMTRKRRRMREEQSSAAFGSKDDYYYDGTSSIGGVAAAGTAAGGAAAYGSRQHSSDNMSMPSLHQAYSGSGAIHPPADDSTTYGWDLNTSYAVAGTAASTSVPAPTNEALKQQLELANRLSIVSQDDSMLGFPAVPGSSTHAPASATAAYALNKQMSLKQELDDEDEASPSQQGSPELYYLPVDGPSPVTTASQAFLSAQGSPGTATASASVADGGATTTRSSAYETVASNSSAYATADSPSWSAASLQSQDITIPMPPNHQNSAGSTAQQANIHDLIRDVLRDD